MTTTTVDPATVLALPLAGTHDGLTVAVRHWPEGIWRPELQDQITAGASWEDVAGPATAVTLTTDGQPYWSAWCKCPAVADEHWVRYERWSAAGLEAHGYAHKVCRAILQTG